VGLDRRRGWGEGGRGRGRGRGGFLGGEKRSYCSSVASSSITYDHTISDLNSTTRLPLADTAMLASSEVGQIGESGEFDRCLLGGVEDLCEEMGPGLSWRGLDGRIWF